MDTNCSPLRPAQHSKASSHLPSSLLEAVTQFVHVLSVLQSQMLLLAAPNYMKRYQAQVGDEPASLETSQ